MSELDPTLLPNWAENGNITPPEPDKLNVGWLKSDRPTHGLFNWLVTNLGAKINHVLANGIANWSQHTSYTSGSLVTFDAELYIATDNSTGVEPPAAPWQSMSEGAIAFEVIKPPVVLAPSAGATDYTDNIVFSAGQVNSKLFYGIIDTFEMQIAYDAEFTNIKGTQVVANPVGELSLAWGLEPNVTLYVRGRYGSGSFYGPYSEVVSFSTPAVVLFPPASIVVEGQPDEVPETPNIAVGPFVVLPEGGLIYRDTTIEIGEDTENILYSLDIDLSGDWNYTLPAGILNPATTYTFSAKHNTTTGQSSDLVSVTASTKVSFTNQRILLMTNGQGVQVYEYNGSEFVGAATQPSRNPSYTYGRFDITNQGTLMVANRWDSTAVETWAVNYDAAGDTLTFGAGANNNFSTNHSGSVAFDINGELLALGASNLRIRNVNLSSGIDLTTTLTPPTRSQNSWDCAWHPSNMLLAIGYQVGAGENFIDAYIVDSAGPTSTQVTFDTVEKGGEGTAMQFSPNGELLVCFNNPSSQKIFVWYVEFLGIDATFTPVDITALVPQIASASNFTNYCVAFNPAGDLMTLVMGWTARADRGVVTFHVAYNGATPTFTVIPRPAVVPPGLPYKACYTADGKHMVVAHAGSAGNVGTVYDVVGTGVNTTFVFKQYLAGVTSPTPGDGTDVQCWPKPYPSF